MGPRTSATTVKSRRSHRKSRNGCLECKHRHIRCDEHKPLCLNCKSTDRVCSFTISQTSKPKPQDGQVHRAQRRQSLELTGVSSSGSEESAELPLPVPATTLIVLPHLQKNHSDLGETQDERSPHRLLLGNSPLPSITGDSTHTHTRPSYVSPTPPSNIHTPLADCYPGLLRTSDAVSEAIFTPQHLVLMHNAYTVPNFIEPNRDIVDIAIRYAIDAPYLIDEVLAFTAFHMAGVYPGSAVFLRRLATELQTRGLASFTRLTENVPHDDIATAVPRFLFSCVLGRHVLADSLIHCHTDFRLFIDRFVECINLNRGIRAVTPPAWEYLSTTEVQPFLNIVREADREISSPGTECDALNRLMDRSDLNETSKEACRQAIKALQRSFDLCHSLNEEDYPQSASSFSVRIEADFVEVLRKQPPEALVILAYYGVLLYRCRTFWAFRDAGASMIRVIARQLGSYWQEALAWPLYVLETESTSQS